MERRERVEWWRVVSVVPPRLFFYIFFVEGKIKKRAQWRKKEERLSFVVVSQSWCGGEDSYYSREGETLFGGASSPLLQFLTNLTPELK